MTESIKEIMKEIADMGGKKGGGEGSQDMDLGEIQELIDTTPEEVTEDSLREISGGLVFRPQHFLCYDLGLIPVQGTKILQTMWRGWGKKKNDKFDGDESFPTSAKWQVRKVMKKQCQKTS